MTSESLSVLAIIGEIDPDKVATIKSRLAALSLIPPLGKILEISNSELPEIAASALSESIMSLHQAADRQGTTAIDLLTAREAVETDEKVLRGIKVLAGFTDVSQVKNTSKALDLMYDRDNLLQRTRIMTDIRPLFSSDAGSVEGCVVAHTLRISFDTGGNNREVSFAIDESDLQDLIETCQRAILKAKTAKTEICEKANTPVLGSGE